MSTSTSSSTTTTTTTTTATAAAAAAADSKTAQPATKLRFAKAVAPGDFEAENHFYPRVLNAQIHPMVGNFLALGNKRIASRYCHLHPEADIEQLEKYLKYQAAHFRWAGSDLFSVADGGGRRQMIVIETNSSPSGQKSMPFPNDENESAGYHTLLGSTFVPWLAEESKRLPKGGLAVMYDKNPMEASGYAAELAELTNETVYLAEFYHNDSDPPVKFEDGIMYVRAASSEWIAIRASFRYVTYKPWNRIPLVTKTLIMNPTIACLAGGRNKMIASKAYEFFNSDLEQSEAGLAIRTPETIKDVSKAEVPLWIKHFGGHAVIKVPYSNAGQGVYTITNADELKAFMAEEFVYDKFIVQSLVGNSKWTSTTRDGTFFHIGTVPNKKCTTYVSDIRCMVACTPTGWRPVAVYARRAAKPLVDELKDSTDSWSMLGTNLSVKNPDGSWTTESNRLLIMDRRDFNKLGIGLDDLIDAYVQSVLSTIAIDRMTRKLLSGPTADATARDQAAFQQDLFKSLNDDDGLINEILLK